MFGVDSQKRNRFGVVGFEVLQQGVGCRGRIDDASVAGDVRDGVGSLRAAGCFGREGCDFEVVSAGGDAH